jgi:hypothetical protein
MSISIDSLSVPETQQSILSTRVPESTMSSHDEDNDALKLVIHAITTYDPDVWKQHYPSQYIKFKQGLTRYDQGITRHDPNNWFRRRHVSFKRLHGTLPLTLDAYKDILGALTIVEEIEGKQYPVAKTWEARKCYRILDLRVMDVVRPPCLGNNKYIDLDKVIWTNYLQLGVEDELNLKKEFDNQMLQSEEYR